MAITLFGSESRILRLRRAASSLRPASCIIMDNRTRVVTESGFSPTIIRNWSSAMLRASVSPLPARIRAMLVAVSASLGFMVRQRFTNSLTSVQRFCFRSSPARVISGTGSFGSAAMSVSKSVLAFSCWLLLYMAAAKAISQRRRSMPVKLSSFCWSNSTAFPGCSSRAYASAHSMRMPTSSGYSSASPRSVVRAATLGDSFFSAIALSRSRSLSLSL